MKLGMNDMMTRGYSVTELILSICIKCAKKSVLIRSKNIVELFSWEDLVVLYMECFAICFAAAHC